MNKSYEDLKEDRNGWCTLAQEAGAAIGGFGHLWDENVGLVARARKLREERDTLKAADDLNRKAIAHRDDRIAELKSTHPPEDWLTRAIELSGAESDADWGDLLKRIEWLGDRTPNEHLKHLRERAEAAESKASLFEQDLDAASCRADAETARANRLLERAKTAESERDESKRLVAWLEEEHTRLTHEKRQAWIDSENTPTPPLDRIAADVARIAEALEKRNEPLADAEPYIHTQHGGKFNA